MQKDSQTILGCIEQIAFPELGIDTVYAKIDTGAYSGALHCYDLKVMRRKTGKVLRFRPVNKTAPLIEVSDFRKTFVRSASGHQMKRYIIDTEVIIQGKEYKMSIGLADRVDMRMDVLVGRRFLRKYDMLVDVRRNAELDVDGGGKD